MPHDKTETVFFFDELEDDAKEKARDWYRSGALDYEWWDAVYEDAITCAAILGIRDHIRSIFPDSLRRVMVHASKEHTSYAKGSAKEIRKHAPQGYRSCIALRIDCRISSVDGSMVYPQAYDNPVTTCTRCARSIRCVR